MSALEELHRNCLNCKKCALWENRQNVVFGGGNPNAEVMFIGEGPGEQEDKTDSPCRRAGQLLDDMLYLIDLNRTNVYIANIVKCRPRNRDPLNTEQEACSGWLRSR